MVQTNFVPTTSTCGEILKHESDKNVAHDNKRYISLTTL